MWSTLVVWYSSSGGGGGSSWSPGHVIRRLGWKKKRRALSAEVTGGDSVCAKSISGRWLARNETPQRSVNERMLFLRVLYVSLRFARGVSFGSFYDVHGRNGGSTAIPAAAAAVSLSRYNRVEMLKKKKNSKNRLNLSTYVFVGTVNWRVWRMRKWRICAAEIGICLRV